MIFHAADGKRQQIVVSADGRGVSPQPWKKGARQELLAVLSAEYEVDVVLCVSCGTCFWPLVMLHDERCVAAYTTPPCENRVSPVRGSNIFS